MAIRDLLCVLCCFSLAAVQASSSAAASPSSNAAPTPSPSIVQGVSGYTYLGCYNETTGDASVGNTRALSGGTMNASDTMTVQTCLKFCGNSQYAGLEYGRECWCAPDLNQYANKVSDAQCTMKCSGNSTQICGDRLRLSTYQRKAGANSNDATGQRSWIAIDAIVLLFMAFFI